MDNFAVQVCFEDKKWHWLVWDDFAGEYLVASPSIENNVIWFDCKSDAVEYINDSNVKQDSNIIIMQDDGQDLAAKIVDVRIVKVEAVEV